MSRYSLIVLVLLAGCSPIVAEAAPLASPEALETPTAAPLAQGVINPSPTPETAPTAFQGPPEGFLEPPDLAGGVSFGSPGQVQCWNCTPFDITVRLHHYDPPLGDGYSCWLWDDEKQYCMSETKSGIPWESVYGFGAACPVDWPHGTWIIIPEVGAFICFDTGKPDYILCDPQTGVCHVDLLTHGYQSWDGLLFAATIWVPLKP